MRYFRVQHSTTPIFVEVESATPVWLIEDDYDRYYTEDEMRADVDLSAALDRWDAGDRSLEADDWARDAVREVFDPASDWGSELWLHGLSAMLDGDEKLKLLRQYSDREACAAALEVHRLLRETGLQLRARYDDLRRSITYWEGPEPVAAARAIA